MTSIERQVHLDAAPMTVAAALAASPWRAALTIEPVGAGTTVTIEASIEPVGLARSIEALALDELCRLKEDVSQQSRPNHPRTTTQHQQQHSKRRTTMTTLTRNVTIDGPVEKVWPALADFGGISTWNPNVKLSHLTSTEQAGEGITRECQLVPIGTVQERVTEWVEGRMLTVEIFEFKNVPAMRSAVAVFDLEPNGSQTNATMQLTYEVGLGAVGAGMNSMMMKRQFAKAVTGLLAGLKHYVETGNPVDRRSKIPTAAVTAA
ncbi:MAG: SRPBCC family protein [Acidimicrobiales bacterium]